MNRKTASVVRLDDARATEANDIARAAVGAVVVAADVTFVGAADIAAIIGATVLAPVGRFHGSLARLLARRRRWDRPGTAYPADAQRQPQSQYHHYECPHANSLRKCGRIFIS
jgi:hypothetical protein